MIASTLPSCSSPQADETNLQGNDSTSTSTSTPEKTQEASKREKLLEIAGAEEKIRVIALQASTTCKTRSFNGGIPLSESQHSPDEFVGAYLEEEGEHIRYIVVGTIPTGPQNNLQEIAYSCIYAQIKDGDKQTYQDTSLGVISENDIQTTDGGVYVYATLRDSLREFHGTKNDYIPISDIPLTEAIKQWETETSKIAQPPTLANEIPSTRLNSGFTFSDGIHLVGIDIQPGLYRNDGSTENCYWARLSGLSGQFADLIANGNPQGQTYVEIFETDRAFESKRCGDWELTE